VIPRTPIDIRRTMMLGSMSVSRIRFQSDISTVSIRAPSVSMTMPFGFVFSPSISVSSAGSVGATTSTTFIRSASCAPRLEASRTALSAQSAFRPCSRASSAMYAAASFTTFFLRSLGISPPPAATGVEEPRFVCGAIAATSAAMARKTPADAAREPGGDT
jgi:hypothetical protein